MRHRGRPRSAGADEGELLRFSISPSRSGGSRRAPRRAAGISALKDYF